MALRTNHGLTAKMKKTGYVQLLLIFTQVLNHKELKHFWLQGSLEGV